MVWVYSGSTFFAEIEPTTSVVFSGVPATGRYRLKVEIRPMLQPRPPNGTISVIALWGGLSTQSRYVALLLPDERCSVQTANQAYVGRISLAADLDLRQLLDLDAARGNDGVLQGNLQLWGLANGPDGMRSIYGQDSISVSQEQWLRILAGTGFAETVLIEVIAPSGGRQPRHTAAVQSLSTALARLHRRGEEADAVAACRTCLDKVRPIPPLPEGVALQLKGGLIDDLAWHERVQLLKYALRHAAHYPHHTTEALPRQDAELVVKLTAILLENEIAAASLSGVRTISATRPPRKRAKRAT
jgi:hypothetical protein